jgi:hypothetical protein
MQCNGTLAGTSTASGTSFTGLTVSYRTIKAATADPVKSLKYE